MMNKDQLLRVREYMICIIAEMALMLFIRVVSDIVPPCVVLSDFSISNQVIRPGNENVTIDKVIMDMDEIELSHDQNDLSFAFSTLHFSRPAKNTVSYRLEGYQNEWISDDKRYISFTNLDPGEYRFRVKGISGDGIPAIEEASLAIIITPPWWTTT